MLIDNLKTRRNLVLAENSEAKYVLYSSNKKETEELEVAYADKKLNEFLREEAELNMCGHVNEVNEVSLKDLISLKTKHTFKGLERGEEDEVVNEFKCYSETKQRAANNNVYCHQDRISSFRCACEKLQIDWFIVLREKVMIQNIFERGSQAKEVTLTNELLKDVFNEIAYKSNEDGNSENRDTEVH